MSTKAYGRRRAEGNTRLSLVDFAKAWRRSL
jgi:hypothetical protein